MTHRNSPARARTLASSLDESAAPILKKRKLQRACDYCRSKKVKCDGPRASNNCCSNCAARRAECTYFLEYNSGYPRSYVETLENRVKRMEQLVGKLCSAVDRPGELDNSQCDDGLPLSIPPAYERSHVSDSEVERLAPPSTRTIMSPPELHQAYDDSRSDRNAVELNNELVAEMRKLYMQREPFRYHGKWSGLMFIRSAMALKDDYTGSRSVPKSNVDHARLMAFVEDDFPVFDEGSFPPLDLFDALVDLYFRHVSCHYPLLHEPTVRNAIRAGQHLHHGPFGATVLLMCAIGARFTRDPRVLPEPGANHPHSAGWKWFGLVEGALRLSFAPAKLHSLQVYALMALFLLGSASPQAAWTMIGAGIRAAIDIGAHRRKTYAPTPTVEEELWRRAFWTLVHLEWLLGYALGRPCSIQNEDFDLALPTECDDEYWVTPEGEPLFKQAPGQPSKVTAFVCLIRLGWILAFVTRTIYSSRKCKAQRDQSDEQWEKRAIAELDSGLNKWADSLPSHLRWDPEQENTVFLIQAATLNACFYGCQMAVHRKFLTSSESCPSREFDLSLPSAIICTNAARSSIQIIEVLYHRTGSPKYRNVGMLFLSAMVLVTNAFGVKRTDGAADVRKDLKLAGKAIEMLKSLQYEVNISVLLAETLNDLVSAIDEPLPPEARTSQTTQSMRTGTGRPRSPTAPPPERSLCPENMGVHDTNWLPTVNNASPGPSFRPSASAHPVHFPLALGFPQAYAPFALPFKWDGLALPESLTQRRAVDSIIPPLAMHPHEYDFRPRYDPRSDAPASTDQRFQAQYHFNMTGGNMLGTEEAQWSGGSSSSSSPLSPTYPQAGMNDYGKPHHHLAGMAIGGGAGGADTDMHNIRPMELDAPMMWHNFSPVAGQWRESWTADGAAADDY